MTDTLKPSDDVRVRVCIGPPCTGESPETCQLCTEFDPFSPTWEADLAEQRKPQ